MHSKALIIGSDFLSLQLYWSSFNNKSNDVCGFIHVPESYSKGQDDKIDNSEEIHKPTLSVVCTKDTNIPIYEIKDLEKLISIKKVQKCIMFIQNVPMLCVNKIVYRIVATGSCSIEFFRPKDVNFFSTKPLISFQSHVKKSGKTQICRFCTSYLRQYRKIAIVIPLVEIDDKILSLIKQRKEKLSTKIKSPRHRKIDDGTLSIDQDTDRIHFEFRNYSQAVEQKEWLSDTLLKEIEDYFTCGAFCVYVSANIELALLKAERLVHIIFYDAYQCEIPLIKPHHQICITPIDSLNSSNENIQWPGLVNFHTSQKIVVSIRVPYILDDKTKKMLYNIYTQKKNKENQEQTVTFAPQVQSSGDALRYIDKRKNKELFFVNSIYMKTDDGEKTGQNLNEVSSNSSFFSIDDASSSGILVSNNSSNEADNGNNANSNNNNNLNTNANNNSNMNNMRDSSDDHHNIITFFQDNIPPMKVPVLYPIIVDYKNSIKNWLLPFFISHFKPSLQDHFEAQDKIIISLAKASENEIIVTNHSSANREALCRLFLCSHLPQGFRVTNGEIIDAYGYYTGQLDVVIVNESAPFMTIGATNSVIAPILADNVLGVIEVKTIKDSENLGKALSQLRPVKALMPMHSTLEDENGEVKVDPLAGKIVTGVLAVNTGQPSIDDKIAEQINAYPNVADFIVLLDNCSYFRIKTLEVCGIEVNENQSKIVNGYVRYDANGIGLALIFGILNFIAAARRFSGNNCVRYLSGKWSGQDDNE